MIKTGINLKLRIMKTRKFFNHAKFFGLVVLAILFVTSCWEKDDDDNSTDFIGTWVTVKSVPSDEGYVEIQDIIDFTEKTFTETGSIWDPESEEWIDIVGRKGKITASDGEMDVNLTELGYTLVDEETQLPLGIIVYYAEGTEEFNSLLYELEMSKNYKAEYTVSEDELTLKADNNNNGSFDDDDEVNTFSRVY